MRRRITCAALAALALLLPACTDEAPSPPPPTTTQTTTPPTPAPTPTSPPPSPPPASKTPAGAEAFVRYFWETYNYAYATLDPAPLTSISEKACKFCASAASDVARLRQEGTRVQDTAVVVTAAVAPPDEIAAGLIVTTVVRQNPGSSTSASGSTQTIEPVPNRRSYVGLHWLNGAWIVNGVTMEKS